jgi:hypothetical protein
MTVASAYPAQQYKTNACVSGSGQTCGRATNFDATVRLKAWDKPGSLV